MKPIVIAVASALLLAVAVTELSQRIWPDSRLALLLLCFIALLVSGLFNVRQAQANSAAATTPARPRQKREATITKTRPNRGTQRAPKAEGKRAAERAPSGDTPAGASSATGAREQGTVKWFNRSKGFGFVIRPNGEEIFVHQRSIRSEDGRGRPALRDGESVSFTVAERDRGLQAEDVTPERASAS